MKKLLALILTGTMVLSLAACSGSGSKETDAAATTAETSAGAEDTAGDTAAADTVAAAEGGGETAAFTGTYPEEKVLIGVEIYDPTDSEFLELKDYFDYVSEHMNVEFKFSEAIQDAEQEMKFIEDCAMAGAKGILCYYNVSGVEQVNKILEYEMYCWGGAEETDIYETHKENSYYLGSVNAGNFEYEAGKAIGEWAVEQGFQKVIYSSGGADFGVEMFLQRRNGFMEAVGDSMEVIDVSGFPGDQFFADQSAALAEEGVEAVCASFNGVDFWAQPIEAAGLKDSVKLATVGSISQNYLDSFTSGTVDMVAAKNIQAFGLAIPMICNAADGNADALKEGGLASNIAAPGWIVTNAEDCEKILSEQTNRSIISVDDMLSLCKNVNPDASAETLQTIVDATSLDAILSK